MFKDLERFLLGQRNLSKMAILTSKNGNKGADFENIIEEFVSVKPRK